MRDVSEVEPMENQRKILRYVILFLVIGMIFIDGRFVLQAGRYVLAVGLPLWIGVVLAYVIHIPMTFFEKKYSLICKRAWMFRYKKGACLLLSFFCILFVAVVLWQLVVPSFVACASILLERFPSYTQEIGKLLEKEFPFIFAYVQKNGWKDVDMGAFVSMFVENFCQGMGNAVRSAVHVCSKLVCAVIDGVLGLVFAIYLLLRKEVLMSDMHLLSQKLLRPKQYSKLRHLVAVIHHAFYHFVVGQFVEAVLLGVLCGVGMWILRFPYPVVVGSLVGCTALIPVAGAYIGAAVGALMICTISPWKSFLFLIFLMLLQQVEGNLIYPRVVGSSIGLPPIWVLAAVIVGGGIWGILGMFLSVPLAAVGYRLFHEWLESKENIKK